MCAGVEGRGHYLTRLPFHPCMESDSEGQGGVVNGQLLEAEQGMVVMVSSFPVTELAAISTVRENQSVLRDKPCVWNSHRTLPAPG